MKFIKALIQARVQSLVILYWRILSDPLAFRYVAIFMIFVLLSFPLSLLASSLLEGRVFLVPLFDIPVSSTALIFSVRYFVVFLIGAVLFGSFSFKKAAVDWDNALPPPVALLRGVVSSQHIDGVYTGSTFAFLFVVGGTFGDIFSAFTLLLLWELLFFLQLFMYHTRNPEYGIPTLYAAYFIPRGKRVLIGMGLTAGSYVVAELGKTQIHEVAEDRRHFRQEQRLSNQTELKYSSKLKIVETELENNKTLLELERLKAQNSSWWWFPKSKLSMFYRILRSIRTFLLRRVAPLIVVMSVAVSLGAGMLLSHFADLEDETIPLFDISTGFSAPLSSIILVVWTVSVSSLIIFAVVLYSLRKIVSEWSPLLPPTVAFLYSIVNSLWIRKLYLYFSVLFVALFGTFGDIRLLSFGILLLWELLFTVHLLFYHIQDPNYGILPLYGLYLPLRLRQLRTTVLVSTATFILMELAKSMLLGS